MSNIYIKNGESKVLNDFKFGTSFYDSILIDNTLVKN